MADQTVAEIKATGSTTLFMANQLVEGGLSECTMARGFARAPGAPQMFGNAGLEHKLERKAVEILGMAMATDMPSTFDEKSMIELVGFDLTRKAAEKVYQQSGFGPENADVVELHDCFSCNELITYEGLGLCPVGKGGAFVDSGANTYGGKVVVNPSGGLISKGHPLGATGLAQCAELDWQLRGEADRRQVAGAKIALQHNLGLGGAAVVAMYRKATLAPGAPIR